MDFYKKYPTVTFNTLYDDSEWKVFACVLFNTQEELGEVYPYHTVHEFANKEAFNSYILDIMDRSVLWTDVDLTYGDSILTLSTCDFSMFSDMRLVVMARKVRDNESLTLDTSTFIDNTGFDEDGNVKRKMFEAYYETYSCEWGGRKWGPAYIKDFKGYNE